MATEGSRPCSGGRNGRAFRLLTILEEYSRECLAIEVQRQMKCQDVLDQLAELFVNRGGIPIHRIGQRLGVHGWGSPGLAQDGRSQDAVHRARQSLGERICGELQREAAG